MSEEKNETKKSEKTRLNLYFVKRPDLRPDEFLTDLAPNEFDASIKKWDLFIHGLDLGEEEAPEGASQGDRVWPLVIAEFPWVCENIDDIAPFDLLSLFCACQESKVYPPGWVLDALYSIFNRYITSRLQGKHISLGKLFGENRAEDWQRATAPLMETAIMDVHHLIVWFSRPPDRALDIVSRKLEAAQAPELLPPGWSEKTKIKKRGALEEAYKKNKSEIESTEIILANDGGGPTTEHRDELLQRLGEDALIGEDDLLDRLRQINKKTKR